MATETNYDARRVRPEIDSDDEYLARFAIQRNGPATARVDVDSDPDVPPTLPDEPDRDLDLDGELTMPVVAQRRDEFTCARCFLVLHHSRRARTVQGRVICRDCS